MDNEQAYVIALLERIAYNTSYKAVEFNAYIQEIKDAVSVGKAAEVYGGGVSAQTSGEVDPHRDERRPAPRFRKQRKAPQV